jgi:hypothetical protein
VGPKSMRRSLRATWTEVVVKGTGLRAGYEL